MDISNTFDRVVLVNLKRRPDRLANFWNEIEKCKFPFRKPEVFQAIDGNTLPVPKGWQSGSGAWGCKQSHVAILQQAIMDGVRHILVLEDDACFTSNFAEEVEQFLSQVPPDYDGLMLGGQHIKAPQRISDKVVRCTDCQRTHAYSARGRYLRDLYAKWTEVGQSVHIDWTMGPFQAGYKVFAPEPFLIGQDRSKSDINGQVNPRKTWNPPSQDAPLILFEGPRTVLEDMREFGWHIGNNRDKQTGIDMGLLNLFHKKNPRRALQEWVNMLQWEAASMENAIVVVWHPQATKELLETAWTGPCWHIKADTVAAALAQMPSERTRIAIPSRHMVVLLKAPKQVAQELSGHGFHRGHWRDTVTDIDNGLRKLFAEGVTAQKLADWLDVLTPEAEAMRGVVTVWHPEATKERLEQATKLKVIEIEAETTEEAIKQYKEAKNALYS